MEFTVKGGMMEKECRVVLVDDHPLIRSGVRSALSRVLGVKVVAEAGDGDEALQQIRDHRPDLVILDIHMPGVSSDRVVELARMEQPELKILVLSAFDDEAYIRRFSQVSINGYMLKDEAPEGLAQAVRVILQGAAWFSSTVASRIQAFRTLARKPANELFTSRERRVMALLLSGLDNQAIADELCLARQTIRNMVSNIYQKMGVRNRIQASVWARDNPWAASATLSNQTP